MLDSFLLYGDSSMIQWGKSTGGAALAVPLFFCLMDEHNERFKTLKNGAVYDLEKKQIVRGPALSYDEASALVKKREEKRRAVMLAEANKAVEDDNLRLQYGDLAWIGAVTRSLMKKALNPKDPKQVEAFRTIAEYTGESPKQDESSGSIPVSEMRGLLRDIAAAARAISETRESE